MPGRKDYTIGEVDPIGQRVWDTVSGSPIGNLWDFQGVSPLLVFRRTFNSLIDDNLLSRAAELGFYFLFALFPTLVSASAILGLAAKTAPQIYEHLLHYLTLVVPSSAYDLVIQTFQQTAAASSSGKLTLGLVAALWSASVGFSAMQDGMNAVYNTRETRPYWKARGSAILVTVLLSVMISLNLAVLLGGDALSHFMWHRIWHHSLAMAIIVGLHIIQWVLASALLLAQFSVIYYFAPDLKTKRWQWMTPGAMLGLVAWVVASLGLKVYLHYFNSYSVTYGSLGAVIVLLTWFYITGLMLLIGAEINSEIEAAVVERRLKEAGEIPPLVPGLLGAEPAR
jgi:membrane protein